MVTINEKKNYLTCMLGFCENDEATFFLKMINWKPLLYRIAGSYSRWSQPVLNRTSVIWVWVVNDFEAIAPTCVTYHSAVVVVVSV